MKLPGERYLKALRLIYHYKRRAKELENDNKKLTRERDSVVEEIKQLQDRQNELLSEIEEKEKEIAGLEKYVTWVPPGHFYSPIADPKEIKKRAKKIFSTSERNIPEVDLREKEQVELLEELARFYADFPFETEQKEGLRYYSDNPHFSIEDAFFLYAMLRRFEPKRVIEVGSGYSSCVTLDTNELHFNNKLETTFIEPYPELLLSLVKDEDLKMIKLVERGLAEVPLKTFDSLNEGDFLFIDSTHVSRVGSDVNYLFFEILPRLKSGVFIHIHDIFHPFEYRKQWVDEGRAWNEAYILRAFLQNNDKYEIMLFSNFLEIFHHDYFKKHLPRLLDGPGGHIWLRKK